MTAVAADQWTAQINDLAADPPARLDPTRPPLSDAELLDRMRGVGFGMCLYTRPVPPVRPITVPEPAAAELREVADRLGVDVDDVVQRAADLIHQVTCGGPACDVDDPAAPQRRIDITVTRLPGRRWRGAWFWSVTAREDGEFVLSVAGGQEWTERRAAAAAGRARVDLCRVLGWPVPPSDALLLPRR